MTKLAAAPLLVVLGIGLPFPWSKADAPGWLERWLYNARERTARTLESYRAGKGKEAAAAADSALRLSHGDLLASFNAGTAHLAAGDGGRARELLEKAAASPDPAVATAAAYNLGNARLGSGDAAGAVEAYKRALRLTPGHQNAKHNLELALAEREKEKNRLRSPKEGNKNDRPGDKESSPKPSPGQGSPEPKPQPSPQGDAGRSPAAPKTPQSGQKTGPEGKSGSPDRAPSQPLPGFRDQPEMSAREAAAVLESVENLERQKRRTEALERLKRRSTHGRDW